MKIRKVDDKPMVIHTKEKAKIHAHEPKGAKIKGSNIYTVERGPKTAGAKVTDTDRKKSYRKSTIHQSEPKNKGLSRFKQNLKESNTSIKTKNTNLHIAGRTGALVAGAVTDQVEGGQEVSQAAYLAYEASRPVTGTASKGAALFRKKAAAEAKKRIKKVEAGKKLAKKTAKKAAKDTAKTVAKETAKETAKTTAKVATKTATKAAATAAGTAVAPGVGTAIGMAAGYAAGVSIEVKDEKMTNRSRKIKSFLDKMKAQENQTDSVAKLVKDLIVRKAITWVKAAAPIIGLVLLLLVLVVAMIAVPVIAVIAILYNSPFALFLPPLESGDTVQTVTSAYASNRDYVSAKGMTPQETADEDRMVTQAEYGAEIEAETTEKDPSELQYITPIDYAKRIAELDEDLRDAAEILVTDCSCYTPFRAFLMDVVQSDFAFMPNKLDLIRDIALGTDNAERKAYSNNKYGLVEYSIRSGYVKISYKNRNGVRKEGALDWRELYEILSYMVKQPFYCGEDQKKYYQEIKQKADRDKMNPVYKRFFDIEDSVKANRLETRERAIANGWETKIDENGHVASDDAVQKKHNFHYNLWEMEKGGAKTRYQWNMDAIRTLKQIESENRLATPGEQKVLSKFVGWGGLSQAFDAENAGWSKEYAELKELLSDEEYSEARATVNNAFYTSPEIAMCMNSALVQFGFRGGNVLEPSMGIGNFFGSMPETMHEAKLYGVELDSISGRIAKQLYQNANISITGFENTTYPDNFFDVVIGNVPFGDYKVFDPKYNKYNFRIHDYFLAKALDQVRPGGMVAVITTKGTLDKANPTIRKYLAERAELVGAVRLPNTAFKDNAGTEVTADILFLQKRERKIDIEPDWVHLGVTGNGIAVNSYFAEHPEMMLGAMEYDTRIYGQDSRYTVCVNDDENFNMYEALNKAIGNIKAQMTDFERVADEAEQTKEVIPADPDVRNYTYTFFEGKLYYRENSEMVRKEVSQTAEERIRSLDEIRQITRELIDIQMDGCSEEELSDKQRLLNVKYDAFVKQYGAITSKANRTAFRDDSDYPLLCSLEEVNEDGEVKKADMFYKQTIKAKTVIDRVETAVEALNVSVNEFGYVNPAYMLSIYEPDITNAKEELAEKSGQTSDEVTFSDDALAELRRAVLVEELDGLIFLNPDRYNENNPDIGWETADEYLSGNVRDKLRVAKAMAADTDNPQAERFAGNVAALEKVQPEWIEASDIDVKIGTTWIEPLDYEQFIYELLNTPRRARAVRSQFYNTGIQVHLNKMSIRH